MNSKVTNYKGTRNVYPSLLTYTGLGGENVDGRYLGCVMLAMTETKGVIVSTGDNPRFPKKVGDYYEAPSFEMLHWEPFNGEVTLSNHAISEKAEA